MSRAFRPFLVLAMSALAASCRGSPTTLSITTLPRALTAGEQQLVAADNRFAFRLFREIARREAADRNLFISPLSVGMALGMTVNGASGATRDSMLRALELTGLSMDEVNRGYRGVIDLLRGLDPAVAFTLANSIWYRTGITVGQTFLDDTRTYFDADVRALDFASPAPARYFFGDGVTVVDLPYGGRAWSMTIVLPQTAADIDSLVAGLTQDRWDGWMAALDTGGIIVTMPKFTLRYDLEMTSVLSALGMREAFCGPWPTDFSRLYPLGGVCITKVRHKTFVDVYEEGTEAAAVTSVEVGAPSASPVRVVVDRPFLVAIRERLTGAVLFLGRVMNPPAG